MSRIGRKPVAIPAGTDVSIADGNVVTVKGKLGTLTQALSSRMIIKKDGDVINVSRPSDEKDVYKRQEKILMKKGIIGKKLGMTQIFDEAGNVIPVTVLEAGPCVVAQKKTVEKDGYEAVQDVYKRQP